MNIQEFAADVLFSEGATQVDKDLYIKHKLNRRATALPLRGVASTLLLLTLPQGNTDTKQTREALHKMHKKTMFVLLFFSYWL